MTCKVGRPCPLRASKDPPTLQGLQDLAMCPSLLALTDPLSPLASGQADGFLLGSLAGQCTYSPQVQPAHLTPPPLPLQCPAQAHNPASPEKEVLWEWIGSPYLSMPGHWPPKVIAMAWGCAQAGCPSCLPLSLFLQRCFQPTNGYISDSRACPSSYSVAALATSSLVGRSPQPPSRP